MQIASGIRQVSHRTCKRRGKFGLCYPRDTLGLAVGTAAVVTNGRVVPNVADGPAAASTVQALVAGDFGLLQVYICMYSVAQNFVCVRLMPSQLVHVHHFACAAWPLRCSLAVESALEQPVPLDLQAHAQRGQMGAGAVDIVIEALDDDRIGIVSA